MATSQPPPKLDLDRDRFALVQAKLASCSKVVGEAFFPVMVEALAEALSVRWAFLSVIDNVDPGRAHTVAVWDNGPAGDFAYELADTPCADILSKGACGYPDDITKLFPRDQLLMDMGARSYVGTPLRDASGEIRGLLAAMDDKPLEEVEQALLVLELFSGRAAAELERLATTSLNERLGQIVEDSVSEVYLFSGESYRFQLVNRGARDNLGYTMAELRQLTPWDLKPEMDQDEFKALVAPLKRGEIPHLLFETIHRRKDGTTYDVAVQLQFYSGMGSVFYASINDITERKKAEEAQANLAAIVASSNEAIVSKSLEGKVRSWNHGAEQIYGYSAEEMIGKSIRLLIPDDRAEEEDRILDKISRGELISNYETVRLCKGGAPIDVSVSISPILSSTGKVIGASSIAHDITERKRSEAREKLLMREVNHRAKNLLTLVQVIARQTVASDPDNYVRRFEERILALAASHDLLVNSSWENIPLEELVHSQLGHFKDGFGTRILLDGPSLEISAGAAQAFGMALHELATNAAKYGALSVDEGRVAISWQVSGNGSDPLFRMRWAETGGPAVTAPSRSGFGSTVIDRLLKARLHGHVEMSWLASGLVCDIACPASNLFSDSAAPSQPANERQSPRLNGSAPRILVVEDEFLIGLAITGILADGGMAPIGPAASVGQALDLLAQDACDAAILDINLGDETSEEVAGSLAARGIPFITVSGCREADRPSGFQDRPHLSKPIDAEVLLQRIHQLL